MKSGSILDRRFNSVRTFLKWVIAPIDGGRRGDLIRGGSRDQLSLFAALLAH